MFNVRLIFNIAVVTYLVKMEYNEWVYLKRIYSCYNSLILSETFP